MVLIPLTQDLKVTLADPMRSHSGHKAIRVTYGGIDSLDILLRRTVRVPDNGTAYELPPDCGPLPIYSVAQYKSELPEHMAGKGGLFVPIYEREEMWINFKSQRPFAIKIHAGGINAVSGEQQAAADDIATMMRRKLLLTEGKCVQDYVVSGSQLWLDGMATKDGKVMQFVATPVGSGYSVEAQISGNEAIAGLQFEIIPTKRKPMQIVVKTLTGKDIPLQVGACTTIGAIKHLIERCEGIPCDQQRFIFHRKQLEDGRTLANCKISNDTVIHLILRLRGGGPYDPKAETKTRERNNMDKKRQLQEEIKSELKSEMTVAPGGFINQTIVRDPVSAEDWDTKNVIMFNLQLLNAFAFAHLLGITAPPTPITPALYKQYGYSFFKLYEEKSGIKGSFPGMKSVGQLDVTRGTKRTHDDKAILRFPNVELNSIEKKTEFIPVSLLENMLRDMKVEGEVERVVEQEA